MPTIAAVNGAAIGAGMALALACDLRYAAEDARLGMPFTALGMHPGMASTYLVPEVAGLAVAREMLLTGRIVTGAEAAGMGLVNQSLPAGEVRAHALSVAQTVAAAAPVATRLTKAALSVGGPVTFEAALQWEALAQPVTLATEDLQEGLAAQRERRPPRFTGRYATRDATKPPGLSGLGRSPSPCARPGRQCPGGFVGADGRSPAAGPSTPPAPTLWTGLWEEWGTAGVSLWTPVDTPVDNTGDDHSPGR